MLDELRDFFESFKQNNGTFLGLFGYDSLELSSCLPILECEILDYFLEVDPKARDMNVLWKFLNQFSFLCIIAFNLFFQCIHILRVFFIFLVDFLDDFVRLHLQDVNQIVKFDQIVIEWSNGFF